jgi:hypothetical protein
VTRSNRATLDVVGMPEVGPGVRRVVVDCRHGTTTAPFLPGGTVNLESAELLSIALAKHQSEERCACTAKPWQLLAVWERRN